MRNRLANASSPYLRMHADNPVHWQPWDDAALAQARDLDMPILLSIGYSACHWCHVMAHECFENPEIAEAMNQDFVNIKLDREERPDIDHVYQLAHQAFNGRGGGWPLTMFLDPQDLSPFYSGTYFPPTPRHGLPAFPEVLRGVRAYFDQHRDELRGRAATLREWLQRVDDVRVAAPLDSERVIAKAIEGLAARFDPDWGGSRGAPKFPRATELEWLLDRVDSPDARAMAEFTLDRMATRGLQDHLGGGFFRYCVDAQWTIPHFEKMLYDNAQLCPVYARAAVAADDAAEQRARAAAAARGIVDWLARDMSAPTGAFYSALDADSADGEGGFYLWTREQARAALPSSWHALAERAFGLDRPPNFEDREWHLLRATPLHAVADAMQRAPAAVAAEYAQLRERLLRARTDREPPARDDKILTAWNALAIAGLARTARLLDDDRCADMAHRALTAVRASAWIDGELFANAAEPAARIPGFLDDYAFLLDALLETLQLAFERRDLEWAIALADTLCDRFAAADGGFWFSTPQHATPMARSRRWTDDALPSGNGVAIRALLRLGHLVGEARYLECAERGLHAASGALQQYPEACPGLLRALVEFEHPRTQIVVRAPSAAAAHWRGAIRRALAADGTVAGDASADVLVIPELTGPLPGLLATRVMRHAEGTCWVCTGLTCQAPIESPDALGATLHAAARAARP